MRLSQKSNWAFFSIALTVFTVALTSSEACAFDDRDCGRVETVQQTFASDMKPTDNVDNIRTRATGEIVKQAIAQVIGYEVRSNREQNTEVLNNNAQEKYQDAEQALLSGLARVKLIDQKRTASPSGETLTIVAEVKVCVPKPEAIRQAEKVKEQRLQHPPKPVDASTAVWFSPADGQPQIWYSKDEDGRYSFFDNAGFDPATGAPLKPISSKVLREWRASLLRRKHEEAAEAEAAKRAAEQKVVDAERERLAAEKHSELVSHAVENCNKLAANPNDPDKPSVIPGANFDDLRSSADQAIEACEAAVQIEPLDRRLRYQLARAISVNDPKKAMSSFKALCDEHYRAAYDNYGWTFVDRRIGLHNLPAALAFFKKGAQLGDSDAMVSLAGYIQRGKVSGSSIEEAIELYQRAAKLGNDDASKALEPLIASQKQAEQQQQQDMQNAQAIMGLFGGMVGGMRR